MHECERQDTCAFDSRCPHYFEYCKMRELDVPFLNEEIDVTKYTGEYSRSTVVEICALLGVEIKDPNSLIGIDLHTDLNETTITIRMVTPQDWPGASGLCPKGSEPA